jgi:Transport and Golgi organisation 2
MCTVLVAAGAIPGYPLVVVANRDERLGRAARGPLTWPQGFVAPRDEVAGGTWLGFTPNGVFVGITNRFLGPQDPTRVSRGTLVLEALGEPTARAIHERLATLDPRRHNGFHLVYADAQDVLATVSDGTSLAQVTLGRGIHALTERSFGAGDDRSRQARIAAAWSRLAPAGDPHALTALLAEHDPSDPFGSTCIHAPALDYGTRSGLVLALADRPADDVRLWAEGPPCTTPFTSFPGPRKPDRTEG